MLEVWTVDIGEVAKAMPRCMVLHLARTIGADIAEAAHAETCGRDKPGRTGVTATRLCRGRLEKTASMCCFRPFLLGAGIPFFVLRLGGDAACRATSQPETTESVGQAVAGVTEVRFSAVALSLG